MLMTFAPLSAAYLIPRDIAVAPPSKSLPRTGRPVPRHVPHQLDVEGDATTLSPLVSC
jgi:hypothetical protein